MSSRILNYIMLIQKWCYKFSLLKDTIVSDCKRCQNCHFCFGMQNICAVDQKKYLKKKIRYLSESATFDMRVSPILQII